MSLLSTRRAITLLAVAGMVVALGASVAHAGFRPGLIAFYKPDTGGIFVLAPGHGPSAGSQITGGFGGGLAWSPNGETLALTANNSRSDPFAISKIVIVDRGGRVIDTPLPSGRAGALAWSPDGKELVYVCQPFANTGSDWQLCLLNVTTGANRVLLSPTNAFQADNTSVVSWSPRGDEIAYDTDPPVACDPAILAINPHQKCTAVAIAALDVNTGATRLITDPAASAEAPAFSPDGSEIVYRALASPAGSPAGLDVMSASGGFLRNVAPASDTTCHGCGFIDPTWSPDGKKILFNSDPGGNSFLNLFTVDANGDGHRTQISETTLDIYESSWAPLVTTCTVPKLKGQTIAKAKVLIGMAGCVLGKVTGPKQNRSSRHVVNQNPRANKDVRIGTKINIQIR